MGIKLSNGLAKYIQQQTNSQADKVAQDALKKTANDLEIKMKEFIQQYFYDAVPEGEVYKRTGRLLKSVTQTAIKKVGNQYVITIYLNPDKVGDYTVSLKNTSFGNERFYINDFGKVTNPANSTGKYDANSVFKLASEGIHGLPIDGESGWHNNRYKEQSQPTFLEMFEKEIETTKILRLYSEFIKRVGFNVVTKS